MPKSAIPQKCCPRCKKLKSHSAFSKNKSSKDGFSSYCKECRKNYDQAYQEKNRAKKKEYYEKNKEKIRIRVAEKYKRNREQILAQGRKWRREHPEKIKAYEERNRERDAKRRKKYREEHLEQERERHRKYYYANLDKIREKTRQYRKTPHGYLVRKVAEHRRRARLENCEINDFTSKQAKLLLAKTTHCPICGERFLKNDRKALDHIVPLSKGGNNTLLNIWVTHLGCNSKKSNRHYANYGNGQLLLIPKFQESPFKKPEPIILTEKECLHCGIIKPIGMFYENKTVQDGHFGVCKRCRKIYEKEYGKKYKEKRKKFFAEHPEEHLKYLEKQRQWRKERTERDPDYEKKFYHRYREKKLAYAKKYRKKHPEYFRKYAKKQKKTFEKILSGK